MKIRVEREDGSLLIGGVSLANNCQAIMVIFGFFFIFVGVVLTIISYKTPLNAKLHVRKKQFKIYSLISGFIHLKSLYVISFGWKAWKLILKTDPFNLS